MNLQQKEQFLDLVAIPAAGLTLNAAETAQLNALWTELRLEVLMEKRHLGILTRAENEVLASMARLMLEQAFRSKDATRKGAPS